MKWVTIAALSLLVGWPCHKAAAQVYEQLESNGVQGFKHGASGISVVDKRKDTALGMLKVNALKGLEPLMFRKPVPVELADFYTALSKKASRKKSRMIVLLYDFYVSESVPGLDDETGTFHFSADYFLPDSAGRYILLGCVDTHILVQAYDVTKPLMKATCQALVSSYERLYARPPVTEHLFTEDEIMAYHEEERKFMKPYTIDTLVNGAYATWNDFLRMQPMKNRSVKKEEGVIHVYSRQGSKLKLCEPEAHTVAVYRGIPYYSLEGTYCKLYKQEGNYHVKGKFTRFEKLNNTSPSGVDAMFGLTGLIVVTPGKSVLVDEYECAINARTGAVMPIRKL